MKKNHINPFLISCLLLFVFINKSFCENRELQKLNIAQKVDNVTQEKHFVIVVASYNNDQYFKENLDSIFSQDYTNYHVIYTNDASTDNTYENVKNYIQTNSLEDKITLINNRKNIGAMGNLYKMIHTLNNDDIVVVVDGDDFLNGTQVLKTLNEYYANEDVWITYGQFKYLNSNKLGEYCIPYTKEQLKNEDFRQLPWGFSHLRTFYAGLFKRIHFKDLLKDTQFFQYCYDEGIMFPMVEMAKEHTYFVKNILLIYNTDTNLNEFKVSTSSVNSTDQYMRNLKPYSRLHVHPKTSFKEQLEPDDQSDLVVFSYDRPMQLYACLESIQKYSKNLGQVFVIYRSSNTTFDQGYDLVKRQFSFANFYQQHHKFANRDFKPLVIKTSFDPNISKANYIAYCVDDIILTDTLDWQHAITKMQQTGAYGFFFRLGQYIDYCYMTDTKHSIPDLIDMQENTFAWILSKGEQDWNYPNNVDLTLYKKSAIKNDLNSLRFTYPNDMEDGWQKHKKPHLIGLCYENSKMINIPLNVVSKLQNPRNMQSYSPEQLNKMFLAGEKIDIDAFYQIKNTSAHFPIEPTFIPR